MSSAGLPLSRINAAYLESLRADAVTEGRQLDYKEQLPADDDGSKREFVRDVSAFANTIGGDLIYGVRGARDAAGVPTGAPEAIVGLPGINLDQAQLRLDSLLQNGVDPRIPGILFHPILRGDQPACLLVRIPQSPLRLHMVTYRPTRERMGSTGAGPLAAFSSTWRRSGEGSWRLRRRRSG
jgi:predicted HTH transcriptional regulator